MNTFQFGNKYRNVLQQYVFRDKYQWHVGLLSLFITYAKAELCDKVGSSVGRSVSKISAKKVIKRFR